MKFKREYRSNSTKVGESLTFLQRKRDEHQEALDTMIESVPTDNYSTGKGGDWL